MNILVACEFSGIIRDAFIKKSHEVISCDLLPSEAPGPHYQGDIKNILNADWDMILAFPPCTHLAVSGARYFEEKRKDGRQQQGIDFFMLFAKHKCKKIMIENPVGIMSTIWKKPDQIIQPYEYGHNASKKTCLWLKGLPLLKSTKIIKKDIYANQTPSGQNKLGPSVNRAKLRSITYQGIADAMAQQWG